MSRFAEQTILGVVATLLLGTASIGPVHAEETNLEAAAMLSGRIMGAAKACGINAERIRRTSERLLFVVGAKASSAAEKASASSYFMAAQSTGAEQVRAEKATCSGIHVSFSEIEVKLGRAPIGDKDAMAAKRGVPALGALRTDGAPTRQ